MSFSGCIAEIQMAYIKDLKYILNDYIRLKAKELSQEEMSHSLSLSMGPEIERTFRSLEVGWHFHVRQITPQKLLADYSSYRRMIENQIGQINDDFDFNQLPSLTPQEPVQQGGVEQPQVEAEKQREQSFDQVLDDNVRELLGFLHEQTSTGVDSAFQNDIDLPMEQYLHLYRTLPVYANPMDLSLDNSS